MTARKRHDNETQPEGADAPETSGSLDDPSVGEAAAGAAEAEELSDLEALQEELSEANRKWLRALADLDNYRKRVEREKARWDVEAREGILLPLLEVVDNFERALSEGAQDESGEDVPFREGVELIFKHLLDVLEKAGVRPVVTDGVGFDPNVHEAVGSVPSDEHDSDEIVQVMQKGYTLGERLLRPSRVIVAS